MPLPLPALQGVTLELLRDILGIPRAPVAAALVSAGYCTAAAYEALQARRICILNSTVHRGDPAGPPLPRRCREDEEADIRGADDNGDSNSTAALGEV